MALIISLLVKMLRGLVLFCAVLVLADAQTTAVGRCTQSSGPLPINTYIAGCDTPPCLLPQLQDVVVNIVFKAPRIMRNMKTLAVAYLPVFLLEIPFPYSLGDNEVTCNFFTNTYCPVVTGEVMEYVLRMYIEPFFPVNTQANIEFRIEDDNSEIVMCIRVPIRIVPPVEETRFSAQNATITVEV